MKKITDIDIDFADRDLALNVLNHTPACIISNNTIKKHPVGVYLHNVPVDPITNFCSIDYKTAEDYGFFKIDFLNVNVYKDVKTNEHLDELLAREPLWELLENEDFVNQLFHINGHFNVVKIMKPKSIEELAMVLALIRPAKRHLVGKSWDEIKKTVWDKTDNDLYSFKKSHSIAYAHLIVVQMNLIVEEIISNSYEQVESDVA